MPKGNCEFHGSGGQYLSVFILHIFLLGLLTLGIYSPWAWVRLLRLKASHTRIDGKPVIFTGSGGQFFLLCLVNGLVTFVTLGIYWPWAACRISQWKAQHTLVDGEPSVFVGKGGNLFLFSLIHFLILPALTLGLYTFYAMYRYTAWKEEHVQYGGARTSFGAGFWPLMRIYLIIIVILLALPAVGTVIYLPALDWLAPLICVIVSPWLICMFFDWETRGLVVGDEEGIEHFPPVRTRPLSVILLILLVLAAAVWGALYVGEWVGTRFSSTVHLGQLLGSEKERPMPPGSVRGRVSRPSPVRPPAQEQKGPSPPQAPKTPSTTAASGKPAAQSGAPETVVPPWPAPLMEAMPSREYEAEIADLDAFIEKDGQNSDAYHSRGWIYARKGDLERAQADLTRAIEISPRSGDAFYNRGLVRARLRDFERAVQDFSQAIELASGTADAYCNRGSVYFQMGQMDLAMKDYAKALEMKPNDPDVYYNRGLVHLSQGRSAEASADFKKAVELRDRPAPAPPKKGVAPPAPPAK